MEVRRADVRVDLGAQPFADTDRAELMMMVVRDDHLAGRDQVADFGGAQALVLGDFDHLLSDDAFARSFKLGHVATSQFHRPTANCSAYERWPPASRNPLYTPGRG